MLQVLPYADIVFCNESEALAFAEANQLGTKDIAEIATKLAHWKSESGLSRTVVITQGHLPSIVARTDDKQAPRQYPVIPIAKEKIVDTNGAGDAFVGGYLSQLVLGKDIDQCVRAGNFLANIVIQRSGATYPNEPCHFND